MENYAIVFMITRAFLIKNKTIQTMYKIILELSRNLFLRSTAIVSFKILMLFSQVKTNQLQWLHIRYCENVELGQVLSPTLVYGNSKNEIEKWTEEG